ncbi:MAG: cell envelope biogenesis protein LolA [Bacteroidetes bacterium]|nr:MAG: cell envelope biogenesis protein LolA [Bacteroidota bacterium]
MKKVSQIIMTQLVVIAGLLLIMSTNAYSQNDHDPKAKAILDEVSKKTKTYKAMLVNFTYIMENKKENISDSQSGELLLSGDRYRLKIAGQIIYSDGKIMWTYIEEAEEVQINEQEEDEGMISPTNIFTIYEKGFKYQFHKEEQIDGRTAQVINLYPEKPKEKSFHTIRLYVDKAKKQLFRVKIFGREGDDYIYKIDKLELNPPISDSDFTFDKAAHPKVEVIDLR